MSYTTDVLSEIDDLLQRKHDSHDHDEQQLIHAILEVSEVIRGLTLATLLTSLDPEVLCDFANLGMANTQLR